MSSKGEGTELVEGDGARKSIVMLVAGAVLSIFSAQTAVGQQGQGSGTESARALEEIIVTAQKREERLQDVPISISVLNGGDLDRSTVQGITEALNRVPGFATLVQRAPAATQVSVRGVSAASANFTGSSAVAYYLDSVPFGFVRSAISPDANAYDLERVEVLRGPQGTLYGASALNGVVRVLTKDANLNEFEAKARGWISSTEGGGESYRADMAVNLPIIEGKLAARAVVGYQDLGGWIDKPIRDDTNDSEIANIRLKINAQPTDALSIGLSVWLSRTDTGGFSAAPDSLQRSSLFEEPGSIDFDAYSIKLGYEFQRLALQSTTSYLDYSDRGVLDVAPFGLVNTLLNTGNDSKVFSQEIILNSAHEGGWRWSLGGMYRDGDERLTQTRTDALTGVLVFPYFAPAAASTISQSFAVFGEVTGIFLDGRLELTGGLRYFEDEISDREHSRRDFVGGVPPTGLIATDSKFDEISPRVVLTWHPGDQATVYASYSEGFRSGMNQLPAVAAIAPDFPPAAPDTLENYELGMKGSLLDSRVNVETAVFYTDWQGVQQQLGAETSPGNFLSAMVNGESASGVGFEFVATVEPVERLVLGVNFGWNDLKVDRDVINPTGMGPLVLFPKGSRLSTSPETTAGASADYAFPLGGGGREGRFSASANYISEMDQRILLGPTLTVRTGDPMLLARTSFSIASPNHWAASIFVDNINNETGTPSKDIFVSEWDLRVRPRTIGAQVEFQF